MKNKTKKIITPAQAVAELKKKYPNDTKVIDEKVIDVRQTASRDGMEIEAAAKAAAQPKEKKPSVLLERIAFLTPLIEAGQHTQPQLVEMLIKQFGLTQSTAQTFLTDSKNAKYNKLPKLVVADDDGKLSFKK